MICCMLTWYRNTKLVQYAHELEGSMSTIATSQNSSTTTEMSISSVKILAVEVKFLLLFWIYKPIRCGLMAIVEVELARATVGRVSQ